MYLHIPLKIVYNFVGAINGPIWDEELDENNIKSKRKGVALRHA